MVGLLTWPAYGTWFARPNRGWIDQDADDAAALPEPARSHAHGRQHLKWPPIELDERRQAVVIRDLARIATLRRFELHVVAAAPDHVHVLLSCEPDRDVPRLVQLIKGALSRALTVAAGDEPAASTRGRPLIHHKWWTRQYSFRRIRDRATLDSVLDGLRAHGGQGATVWEASSAAAGALADIGE